MVFVKHNSLESDIFFNPIFIYSSFFRVQVLQCPGFSEYRFFRVRVRVQGPGSGSRVQGAGFRSGSMVRVQVLEVAPEVFYKKAVFKGFTIFTGKHLCRSLFLSLQLYWKENITQVFSSEYCETFNNSYFEKHLWTAASVSWYFKKAKAKHL